MNHEQSIRSKSHETIALKPVRNSRASAYMYTNHFRQPRELWKKKPASTRQHFGRKKIAELRLWVGLFGRVASPSSFSILDRGFRFCECAAINGAKVIGRQISGRPKSGKRWWQRFQSSLSLFLCVQSFCRRALIQSLILYVTSKQAASCYQNLARTFQGEFLSFFLFARLSPILGWAQFQFLPWHTTRGGESQKNYAFKSKNVAVKNEWLIRN